LGRKQAHGTIKLQTGVWLRAK